MNDEFKLGVFHQGLTTKNCLEKLRYFCEHDAFPRYDVAGYNYIHQSDRFQRDLLTAMNREMMARSPKKAWAPLLDKPLSVLADIPTDVDLIDSPETIYFEARKKMRSYYLMITNINWITDMAASKMLYLKRPKLAAISDSYVRTMLNISEPDTRKHPYRSQFYTARVLSVCDTVRKIGQENITLLNSLQEKMSPVVISKARIVDILIWVEMAISQNHPTWGTATKLNGWDCIIKG